MFADDILAMVETKEELISLIKDSQKATARIGLEIHFEKTK